MKDKKFIAGYFNFETLPDEVKAQNKIKSQNRLDCISYAGNYKGLTNFVNYKGMLYFFKTPCRDFVKANSKRRSEWSLTNNSMNLTSIYIEGFNNSEFGYGYPNAKPKLSNGELNPLYQYKNDGYLFILNPDYSQIELLIIENGRNLINQYYQNLLDGEFTSEINQLRIEAKPFHNYSVMQFANSKM